MGGKLFGDKGYLSQSLSECLMQQDLQLITKIRKIYEATTCFSIRQIALEKTSHDRKRHRSIEKHLADRTF
jgi:hypothetical protein